MPGAPKTNFRELFQQDFLQARWPCCCPSKFIEAPKGNVLPYIPELSVRMTSSLTTTAEQRNDKRQTNDTETAVISTTDIGAQSLKFE